MSAFGLRKKDSHFQAAPYQDVKLVRCVLIARNGHFH
jgi:hypothetical protein